MKNAQGGCLMVAFNLNIKGGDGASLEPSVPLKWVPVPTLMLGQPVMRLAPEKCDLNHGGDYEAFLANVEALWPQN